MKESSYQKEILDILKYNNEIVGFNNLKNMRGPKKKFNPGPLSKALTNLKNGRLITVEKMLNGQTKYTLSEPKINKAWEKITNEKLKPIDNQLKNPDLKNKEKVFLISNYIKKALYLHDSFRMLSLCREVFDIPKEKMSIAESVQKKLYLDVKDRINKLTINEKSIIANVLHQEEPNLMTLKEYREITYIPIRKEKSEAKKKIIEDRERLFQKEPYCMVCGKKSRNYKESEKHESKHGKEIAKNFLKEIKKFEGFYCMQCGKFVGSPNELDKHKCEIKIPISKSSIISKTHE